MAETFEFPPSLARHRPSIGNLLRHAFPSMWRISHYVFLIRLRMVMVDIMQKLPNHSNKLHMLFISAVVRSDLTI